VVERELVCADRAIRRISDLVDNEKSSFGRTSLDGLLRRATAARSGLSDLSYEFPIALAKRDRLLRGVEELRAGP